MRDVATVPAQVLLETLSVLTRLTAPRLISVAAAARAVEALDVAVVGLPPRDHQRLIAELARHDIRGGATYDAASNSSRETAEPHRPMRR
ncbi:hypothetical protein BN12_380018 [Nostocoides japonicum T1-X7]|uniref:Uncharacterized protein n=1 Tax=Nostocoides japonicum T1-X7 TaxID=1194083 RepID=A0A077LZ64_9MICO|nr:hypothetical protein [Tetrasphaera japonica]CCH78936.1 hypothetical protein BN12_380018 [Tetrasphaera japonica T1-X7]